MSLLPETGRGGILGKEGTMQEHTIRIDGIDHQVLISDKEAERRGLQQRAKPAPRNKGRQPQNKQHEDDSEDSEDEMRSTSGGE